MRLRVIILFLFLAFELSHVNAQRFTLVGNIKTDSGKVLEDCNIKITSKKTDRILAFFNTGVKSYFSIDFPFNDADSVFVTSSHVGYKPCTIGQYIKSTDTTFIHIRMSIATDTLNGVVIKGPPIWIRGDTTFFRADAFKTGSEIKLKDLITKMPGFEIDDKGNLFYKKKLVEKIMIDGEELFADKIKLMLDNFPVHVLNTVQAIENQTNDRLLRGLVNEDRVFVNLGLNTEKLRTAFGDGEGGVGTGKKYFFNPVIFSMYGKLKLGYIGNWDNIGNGIGWKQQDELKNNSERSAEMWTMANDQLQVINNFENRRYITNGQIANHFQLNLPTNHKIKSKTEFNLVTDHQSQLTYNSSSIYNGDTYIKRNDTSHIYNDPYLLTLKHSITWNIDSARELDAAIFYYHNGNKSMKNTNYYEQGAVSSTYNKIANSFNSFDLTLNYTHRKSLTEAEKWYSSISRHYEPQEAYGSSSSWPVIFQLNDSAYQLLHQSLNDEITNATAGLDVIKKTKAGLLTTGVQISSLFSSTQSVLYLNDLKNTVNPIFPGNYNNTGYLHVISITTHAGERIKVLKIPLSFNAKYGFSMARKNEDTLKANFITPVFKFGIDAQKELSIGVMHKLELSFSQEQAQPYQLYSFLLPDMINSFHKYSNTNLPVKELNSYYFFSYAKYKKYIHTSSIVLGYTRNFSDFTSINSLKDFATYTTDSLINLPLNSFYLNAGTNVNSFDNKSLNYFSVGMNKSQTYIQHEGKLLLSRNFFYSFNMSLQRNWGQLYYLNLETNSSYNVSQLPKILIDGVSKNIFNNRSSLSQRIALSKHSNIILTTQWFDNNIFTSQQISFLFMDAEFNFTLPQKHLSFILRLQNITNQHYYRSWYILPGFIQNFYTIPLVSRNAFVSVRYEL